MRWLSAFRHMCKASLIEVKMELVATATPRWPQMNPPFNAGYTLIRSTARLAQKLWEGTLSHRSHVLCNSAYQWSTFRHDRLGSKGLIV
jgi:hypothetical protein